MAVLRYASRGRSTRLVDIGPALGRLTDFDALRQRLDVALSAPRRIPQVVVLAQPEAAR